jgi:hypothetical protein
MEKPKLTVSLSREACLVGGGFALKTGKRTAT